MSSHNPNDIFDPKRYGLITGSRVSVLFPIRSAEVGQKQYAKELANNMYFRFYDNQSTWQTEHGNLCESTAFEYYQSKYDSTATYQPPFMCVDDFGGQADCVCESYGVDFKCPTTLKGWLDYLHEGISKEQYHQAQMYMMLYNREQWKVVAFLMETDRMSNNGEQYPVNYNQRCIITTVDKDPEWEIKLKETAPYVIGWRDYYYQLLIKTFGTK